MGLWGFWIATALLTLVSVALVMLALRRGAVEDDAQDYDVQVYRDQLAEVERDLARGILAEEDAERVKTEIARRILAADSGRQEVRAGPSAIATTIMGAGVALFIAVGGYGIYASLGAPGYGDFGLTARLALAEAARDGRLSQDAAEAQIVAPPRANDPRAEALVAELRAAMATSPDDLRGHELLAQNEARLGNYAAAYAAQARVIDLKGAPALPGDLAVQAELMVLAAHGQVSPEAEAVLRAALEADPRLGIARYLLGILHLNTGRPDLTFTLWAELLEEGPEDARWIAPIRSQIMDLSAVAGVRYTPPPVGARSGPTEADIAAAADMSAEDRMAMIRGMVGRRANRLATEGGPPADWAELIRMLVLIGEIDQAEAIWINAQEVFGTDTAAILPILRAAQSAGFAE